MKTTPSAAEKAEIDGYEFSKNSRMSVSGIIPTLKIYGIIFAGAGKPPGQTGIVDI
jgi:hypothetical protein